MTSCLFVTGKARSGTTALANFLDSHEDIRCLNEPKTFKPLIRGVKTGNRKLVGDFKWRLGFESVMKKCKWFGMKFPGFVWMLDELHGVVPHGTRYLFIERDIPDIVFSMVPRVSKVDIEFFAKMCLAVRWKTRKFVKEYPSSCLLITYEDLVSKPTKTSQSIADFLCVDFEGFNTSMLRTSSIGKGRRGFTPEQVDTIERVVEEVVADEKFFNRIYTERRDYLPKPSGGFV